MGVAVTKGTPPFFEKGLELSENRCKIVKVFPDVDRPWTEDIPKASGFQLVTDTHTDTDTLFPK